MPHFPPVPQSASTLQPAPGVGPPIHQSPHPLACKRFLDGKVDARNTYCIVKTKKWQQVTLKSTYRFDVGIAIPARLVTLRPVDDPQDEGIKQRLQKQGVPLQVIMQVGGWKREAMPTRYIGKYDEGELQAFPTADLRSLLREA